MNQRDDASGYDPLRLSDADVAELVAAMRSGLAAERATLERLLSEYECWDRVPRRKKGPFVSYSAEQIAEYLAWIAQESVTPSAGEERDHREGRRPT